LSFSLQGQTDPFTGSENTKTQNYDYTNFDRISILDLDGITEIEVGKPFSVQTSIKDKYSQILEVKENGRELVIIFKYTKDNNKYIKKPNIKVKISCPSLDSLYKRGNSEIFVSIYSQKSLSMTNEGNGSATLKGFVKQTNLKNDGNGKLNARYLSSDTVQVKSFGNGDIVVNAKNKLEGERNGKIIQTGNAKLNETKWQEN
jgi:hypothetical protein